MDTIPFTEFVDINPPVDFRRLGDKTRVSFIPMSDVSENGQWNIRQERELDQVRSGYTPFCEGDLLFAKITPCMENGKGAHAIGLRNGIGFGSTEFYVLRAKEENFPRFLYHWLQSAGVRQQAIAFMGGSAGQQRVRSEFFNKLHIPYLAPAEQQRIATILDTVDEAIAKTEAVIAKLRQVRAGLLHGLLTRGLDEQGNLRDPVTCPEKFCETAIGLLPCAWECLPLGKVADIASGVTLGRNLQKGSGVIELPYLRVANVQDGYLDLSDVKTVCIFADELSRFALQHGDVLMNEGGDYDKLGRGAVWEAQIEPCLHQNHVFRVRPQSGKLNSYFLAAVSSSSYGKRYFIQSSKQSTNLASINSTQLNAFLIPCPSVAEQQAIVAVIDEMDDSIRHEISLFVKFQSLKSGLMSDLLTGQVRVPADL